MSKKIALYPGCLVLYRFPEYEKSATKVLEFLGYKVEGLRKVVCCGSYLEGITPNWIKFGAYTLALAQKEDMELVTLCGGCKNTFQRIQNTLFSQPGIRMEVNNDLKQLGLSMPEKYIQVKHLIQILYEKKTELSKNITLPINRKAALVHPCQVYRPSKQLSFDDPIQPSSMRDIMQITGATIVSYKEEYTCCGASLYQTNPGLAFQIAKDRFSSIQVNKAAIMVTACGNCHFLLQRLQNMYCDYKFPVLFLPQVIGFSLGIPSQELHIHKSLIKELFANAI